MTNKYAKMCEIALTAEAQGEGHIATALIVDVMHGALEARKEDQDAEVFAKYVQRLDDIESNSEKVSEDRTRKLLTDWERRLLQDRNVKRIAARLATIGEDGAQELLDRIDGRPGQWDARAWREWCLRQANVADARGEGALAAVLTQVAKGRSLLAPERVMLAATPDDDRPQRVLTKPRVRLPKKRQRLLSDYIEFMTAKRDQYAPGKDGTRAAQDAFWEPTGRSFRAFQKDLQNACTEWSKKHGGADHHALHQRVQPQLSAWPRGWRWPSDWPLPT